MVVSFLKELAMSARNGAFSTARWPKKGASQLFWMFHFPSKGLTMWCHRSLI